MSNTTVAKTKQGYGYKYTDLAQIHSYLESINMRYYQYIEPCGEFDYIYTVPIKIEADGREIKLEPRRGCRIINAPLSGKSNPAQENGSAITYARRYSLLMAFGLATDDDDAEKMTQKPENNKGTQKPDSNKQRKDTPEEAKKNQKMRESTDPDLVAHGEGMTQKRIERMKSEIERTGYKLETLLAACQAKKLEDLTETQYISCMTQLIKKQSKKETKA